MAPALSHSAPLRQGIFTRQKSKGTCSGLRPFVCIPNGNILQTFFKGLIAGRLWTPQLVKHPIYIDLYICLFCPQHIACLKHPYLCFSNGSRFLEKAAIVQENGQVHLTNSASVCHPFVSVQGDVLPTNSFNDQITMPKLLKLPISTQQL